jgi:hypothetical protein
MLVLVEALIDAALEQPEVFGNVVPVSLNQIHICFDQIYFVRQKLFLKFQHVTRIAN